jgi:hypothetical protein
LVYGSAAHTVPIDPSPPYVTTALARPRAATDLITEPLSHLDVADTQIRDAERAIHPHAIGALDALRPGIEEICDAFTTIEAAGHASTPTWLTW